MTTTATVLLVVAAALALSDWWAVHRGVRTVEYLAKPGTLVALVVVALALDAAHSGVRTWLVIGLVCSLAGDVCLMLPGDRMFLPGLVSFLAGHVSYIVALQLDRRSIPLLLLGVAVVVAGAMTVGRRIIGAVRQGPHAALAGPVAVYLVAISTMVASSFGTTVPWAIAGALLFYASDGILAWNRFVESRPRGPLAVMVTYHLGQAGLVLFLLG